MLKKRDSFITKITKLLSLPCDAPASMWIEISADAFIRFGWEVLSPDAKEIYHHVVGEPLVHSIRAGIDDLGDSLGQTPSKARRFVGKALGVEDRIIWWYFLFSAAKDAVYDSVSLALRQDPCDTKDGFGTGTAWISGIHDDGTWGMVDFQYPPGSKYGPVSPTEVRLWEGNNWQGTVACGAKFISADNVAVGVQSRLQFYPDSGDAPSLVDTFNNDFGDGTPTQDYNINFARYGAGRGQNGWLRMEFSYSGPALPTRQAFLDKNSFCFMNG